MYSRVHFAAGQDVCKPDPSRLRKHLSAIVNFTKFREEKLIPYAEAQERMEAELEIAEQLSRKQHQLVTLPSSQQES